MLLYDIIKKHYLTQLHRDIIFSAKATRSHDLSKDCVRFNYCDPAIISTIQILCMASDIQKNIWTIYLEY